jgi:hypothetical protein
MCIIEVADSSLEHDRTVKQAIYAVAGIPHYIIANLSERRVELYEEPLSKKSRYRRTALLSAGDEIVLRLSDEHSLTIAAALLLP